MKRTITDGGFLTTEVFVPKKVWFQSDVKFTGLTAKSTAFQIIVNVLTANLETLYMSNDVTSLELADSSLAIVEEEFVTIQNQLSKSFNYIKENNFNGVAALNNSSSRDETAAFSFKTESTEQSDGKSEQVLFPPKK